jgi:hypothetical protein
MLAVVVALAGCGRGGEDVGDGGSVAYDAAFDMCSGGLTVTADNYAVEPTREAVAQVVAEQISGGSPQNEEPARQGCLDALEEADPG